MVHIWLLASARLKEEPKMEVTLVMFTREGEKREFSLRGAKSVIGRTSDCGIQVAL